MRILKGVIITLLSVLIVLALAGYALFHFLPQPPASPFDAANASNLSESGTYNILMCGVDATRENADTIIVVSFDAKNNKVRLLSIPRDTMSNVDRTIKKINGSFSHNNENDIGSTIREVQMLTSLQIDRYIITTFDGVANLIDAMGGVPMDVPQDLKYSDPYQDLEIDIKAGQQTLNGKQAVHFLRYRDGYAEGDLGRVKAQQVFFDAFAKKLLDPSNIKRVPALAEVIQRDMETNLSLGETVWFAKEGMDINLSTDVKMFILPGYPEYVDEVSYVIPSQTYIVEMINKEFRSGGTPITAADLNLVYLAAYVSPTVGYGSGQNEGIPTVQAQQQYGYNNNTGYGNNYVETPALPITPEPAASGTMANYGYGGAYVPPAETNTNQETRGYTEVYTTG